MPGKKFRILKFIGILSICTLFSVALDSWGVRTENSMMIFITGVLIVIIETRKLLYGVAASVIFVGLFNFLFTEPKYTFIVDDPNYLITFSIFLVVALIASTLTSNLQKQALRAEKNEENSRLLYEISSSSFLMGRSEQIIQFCIGKIASAFQCALSLALMSESGMVLKDYSAGSQPEAVDGSAEKSARLWCFMNCAASGFGTETHSACSWKYLPLKGRSHVLGVIGIDCSGPVPDADAFFIIETLAAQLALAIERDNLYRSEEQSRLEIEKEKLRNSLLRSISHDLRTPLTAIAGSTDFIVDSFEKLDKQTLFGLLADIGSDALYLTNMVENLLNMTRIQDGKLLVATAPEIVDDVIQEARKRVRGLLGDAQLTIKLPDRVLAINVDSSLIVQVLVNLLTNAVKHTHSGVRITLSVTERDGQACFEVSDNGPGIPEDQLELLFSGRNFTRLGDKGRGTGLGLGICMAIVHAHGGEISAENNSAGGAVFRFSLPCVPSAMEEGEE